MPPGETAIIMHFAVQQFAQAGAIVSAQRLVQLPPEALAGLSQPEIAAIRNFAVPADGISALPALPPLQTGRVVGSVVAGDGSTPVPNATVRLRSANPFFGQVRDVNAD